MTIMYSESRGRSKENEGSIAMRFVRRATLRHNLLRISIRFAACPTYSGALAYFALSWQHLRASIKRIEFIKVDDVGLLVSSILSSKITAASPDRTMAAATQKSGLWGFVVLLGALAFLRSLAPEHTELAVRGLMNSASSSSKKPFDGQREKLKEMTDELKRERIALERLKKEIDLKAYDTGSVEDLDQHSSSEHGTQGSGLPVDSVSRNEQEEEDVLDEQKETENSMDEVNTGTTELRTTEKEEAEREEEEENNSTEEKSEKETHNNTTEGVEGHGET